MVCFKLCPSLSAKRSYLYLSNKISRLTSEITKVKQSDLNYPQTLKNTQQQLATLQICIAKKHVRYRLSQHRNDCFFNHARKQRNLVKLDQSLAKLSVLVNEAEEKESCANSSAAVIQRAWRQYRTHVNTLKPSELGIKSTHYYLDKQGSRNTYYYYQPNNTTHHHIATINMEKDLVRQDEEDEKVIAKNQRAILSKPQDSELDIGKLITHNNATAHHLASSHSIAPSFYISPTQVVTKNVGSSLDKLIKDKHKIATTAFKPLLNEVKQLHQKDIVLLDIKPANLALCARLRFSESSEPIVTRINVSQFRHEGNTNPLRYTVGYIDANLLAERHSLNCPWLCGADKEIEAARLDNMKKMDVYALLISMIEASNGIERLMKNNVKLEPDELVIARKWIRKNIKPKQQLAVFEFLANPYKSKSITLFDVIDWRRCK